MEKTEKQALLHGIEKGARRKVAQDSGQGFMDSVQETASDVKDEAVETAGEVKDEVVDTLGNYARKGYLDKYNLGADVSKFLPETLPLVSGDNTAAKIVGNTMGAIDDTVEEKVRSLEGGKLQKNVKIMPEGIAEALGGAGAGGAAGLGLGALLGAAGPLGLAGGLVGSGLTGLYEHSETGDTHTWEASEHSPYT